MRISYTVPFVLVAVLAGCGGGSAVGVQGSAVTSSSPAAEASVSSDPAASSSSSDAGTSPAADGADGLDSAAPAAGGTTDAGQVAAHVLTAAQDKKTVRVTSTGEGGMAFTGSMRFGDDLAMSLTMSAGGQKMKAVLLGDAFYLSTGRKVDGKSWIKIDESGKGQLGSQMSPMLGSIREQTNPGHALAALKGVSATSSRGPALDGVQTVAYVVKLNAEQIAAGLPKESRQQLGKLLTGATGVTTYYVGPDWLPRKVTTVSTIQGKRSSTTLLYTKWGAPVTITAPPASDVTTSLA